MPRPKSTQPRGKPRGMRRDRDCRNCKLRGVKCDLNRPRCLPCVESGLACGGYPQRVVWAADPAAASPLPTNSKPSSLVSSIDRNTVKYHDTSKTTVSSSDKIRKARPNRVVDKSKLIEQSLTTDQHDIVDRLLALGRSLKTARLSSWAEAHSPQDPRYDQGLELIVQVDNFLQARINRHGRAASGSGSPHSTSSTEELASAHDPSEEDTSMSHRLAALSSLSQALNTADPAAFLGIAVFAFFEVISDRAFGEWDCHLRGARSLLDYHCRSSDELNVLSRRFTGLDEIVAYFGWWDATSTIVRQSTSGGNIGTQEGLIFDDWHRSVLGDDFFNRVGCPREVFWLFVSLAKGSGPADSRERLTQAMAQLFKLGMDNTERGKCLDVYRCAAVIAILTWPKSEVESDISTSSNSSDATLTAAIDRICHIIESTCPRSRFLTHMATPAYLAGMHASSQAHCNSVRIFWRNCQRGEIPRYYGALLQCEERWKERGLG